MNWIPINIDLYFHYVFLSNSVYQNYINTVNLFVYVFAFTGESCVFI